MRGPPERAHEDSDCFRPASGGARGSPAGTGSLRPDASLDTLILAGDIGRHLLAREFVFREMTLSPVIYVPGNHEYYGLQNRVTVDGLWKALAAVHPDLHYLVAEGVEIDPCVSGARLVLGSVGSGRRLDPTRGAPRGQRLSPPVQRTGGVEPFDVRQQPPCADGAAGGSGRRGGCGHHALAADT